MAVFARGVWESGEMMKTWTIIYMGNGKRKPIEITARDVVWIASDMVRVDGQDKRVAGRILSVEKG